MKTLLVTPPFSQLNTPYPATSYLNGFLKSKGFITEQTDLGIIVINKIFSRYGLNRIFNKSGKGRMGDLKRSYIDTIDPVMSFLRGQSPTLAHRIVKTDYLPQSDRFDNLETDIFGDMGIQDHARYLATLYLNDIADYITCNIDSNFGFSRYSERLGLSPSDFVNIEKEITAPATIITAIIQEEWKKILTSSNPDTVCITIPFPGNLIPALLMGKLAKEINPGIKIIIGGGWVNTELRHLEEIKLFNYVDYVVLDDGEAPLEALLKYIDGKVPIESLNRVYSLNHNKVTFFTNCKTKDYHLDDLPAPDYTGLDLSLYISLLDTINPMHSLWNNGRWNKLTLAHGCYWKKCAFCDTSLPYIGCYHQSTAVSVVDKIESIIKQTGEYGFHFVDEAAPPSLLKEVSLEILRRGITVTWWTNIRFEKNFNTGLARLMAKSGCIGVSGGIEVASDRLLNLMNKGVTVDQVALVTAALAREGIMVHAYLMYGFPTQTQSEVIDALEIVRQLFKLGLVQSAYWHQFALTAHSPVGISPKNFNIDITGPEFKGFAKNDLEYRSNTIDYSIYSKGLKTSLFNYMRGFGLNNPLHTWFDFQITGTTIKKNYLQKLLDNDGIELKNSTQIIWLDSSIKFESCYMLLTDNTGQERFKITNTEIEFLQRLLPLITYRNTEKTILSDVDKIASELKMDIDVWLTDDTALNLYNYGLILI